MFEYTEKDISRLLECLSPARLEPFYVKAGGDPWVAFHLYVHYMKISSSLLDVFHVLEISLRNRLHTKLTEKLSSENWWDKVGLLEEPDAIEVHKAKKRLAENLYTITPGAVISELSFGFWVNLFNPKYETNIWVPVIRHQFPPKFSREFLHARFSYVKDIRNRVAHHETLLRTNVSRDYKILLETIHWISPTMARFTEHVSDFPQIFARDLPPKPLSPIPSNSQE